MEIHLSTRQQRIVASALTTASVVVLGFIVLAGFRAVGRFVVTFSGVFLPLATAGVLSLLLRPVFSMMKSKWKMHPVLALVTIFASVLVPLGALVWVFGGMLIEQAAQIVREAPTFLAKLETWIADEVPSLHTLISQMNLTERLQTVAKTQSDQLLHFAAGGAEGALAFLGKLVGLLNWAVLPVYIAFLMMAPPFRRDELPNALPFLKPGTRQDVVYLINQFVDIVVTFFRGQLIIALAQGVLLAIGFSIVGLKYGFLLGLLLGILNIIPYLGNLVGLSVSLPLAYLQEGGGFTLIGLVLLVIVVVQITEGYVLTPKIMGDSTGLHPMVIMVAMFFWGTAMNGIIGMILAIPLTAFLVVLWRLAREKYIAEVL